MRWPLLRNLAEKMACADAQREMAALGEKEALGAQLKAWEKGEEIASSPRAHISSVNVLTEDIPDPSRENPEASPTT